MDSNAIDIDDDSDAEAQAMAAAMGFSSFGASKQPTKKRKFNSTIDAYVEGQELAKLDKGGKKGQGSGGNTMPLGKARVFGSGPKKDAVVPKTMEQRAGSNTNEIDLDDEGEQEEGPRYIDTSKTPPLESEQGDGPDYIDTSQPPPMSNEEANEIQARIDALLESIGSGDPPNTLPVDTKTEQLQQVHGLPQRPAFGDTMFMQGGPRPQRNSRGDSASVASSSRPSHRGQRNEMWYIGYYDPSFNENPWEKLEKERGLVPLCPWPENQGRRMTS